MDGQHRVLRAVCAIVLCLLLVGTIVSHRNTLQESKEHLRTSITSSAWKISEVVYEGEKLINKILLFQAGKRSYDQVLLQFDVFWSRIGVMQTLNTKNRELLPAVIEAMAQMLEDFDPVMYGDDLPSASEFSALISRLDPLIVDMRLAWIREFNESRIADFSDFNASAIEQGQFYEWIMGGLAFVIVGYLLLEVLFATRALQHQRQLSAEAKAASRAKSEFIANVSHEIRTPLNGILGMARVLSETKLTDEQAECLRVLTDAGGVLLSTINDVLDFSKSEAGRVTIEQSTFDVGELLDTTLALYSEAARDKALILRKDIYGSELPLLIGDPRRLRQVVHNLVSNAIKFTTEGEVALVARYVSKATEDEQAGLYIDVRDSGIGIPESAHQRIFEPFGQADSSTTRKFGGTGLGLTISREICRAMGGDLTVRSRMGHGSTFCVYLPLPVASATGVAKEAQAKTDQAVDLSALSVLIVDDNKTNRLILKKFLGATGAQLTECDSGLAALANVEGADFDLILMDIQMPGMDGIEATGKILDLMESQKRVPPMIVGVTANALPHQIEAYLADGMHKILPKPVSKSALIKTLTMLAIDLGHHQVPDDSADAA